MNESKEPTSIADVLAEIQRRFEEEQRRIWARTDQISASAHNQTQPGAKAEDAGTISEQQEDRR